MRFAKYFTIMPALLLAAFALTACVSRTAIIQPPAQPVAATNTSGMASRVLNRVVPSGKTTGLDTLGVLQADCSPRDLTIRITQPPAHGTAIIAKRQDFPSYPAGNPRANCNSTKVFMQYVDYTSDPGFTGNDMIEVSTFTDQGMELEDKILITVK